MGQYIFFLGLFSGWYQGVLDLQSRGCEFDSRTGMIIFLTLTLGNSPEFFKRFIMLDFFIRMQPGSSSFIEIFEFRKCTFLWFPQVLLVNLLVKTWIVS